MSDDAIEEGIKRLARFSAVDYRASTRRRGQDVWHACRRARKAGEDRARRRRDTKGQGKPLDLPSPEPWPEPVNGAALLHNLRYFYARHLVLPGRGGRDGAVDGALPLLRGVPLHTALAVQVGDQRQRQEHSDRNARAMSCPGRWRPRPSPKPSCTARSNWRGRRADGRSRHLSARRRGSARHGQCGRQAGSNRRAVASATIRSRACSRAMRRSRSPVSDRYPARSRIARSR